MQHGIQHAQDLPDACVWSMQGDCGLCMSFKVMVTGASQLRLLGSLALVVATGGCQCPDCLTASLSGTWLPALDQYLAAKPLVRCAGNKDLSCYPRPLVT